MKCIEFLYFYLLPEQSPPSSRSVSSASGTSASSDSSSGESALYPASPLDTPSPRKTRPISRTASMVHLADNSSSQTTYPSERAALGSPQGSAPRSPKRSFKDLDIAFAPETPRKPAQPTLGFPTPSMRRASAASSRAVSGVTVIASSSASSTSMPPPPVPDTPRRRLSTAASANASRQGLSSMPSTPRREGSVASDQPAAISGIVKSPSFMRNVTAIHLGSVAEGQRPDDDPARRSVPSTPTRMTRRDSAILPSSSRESRAARSSSRAAIDAGETASRSSSGTSCTEGPVQSRGGPAADEGRPQKIRHSRTRSQLLDVEDLPPVPPLPTTTSHASPRPQKIRHSRTQSSMAAILNHPASSSAGASMPLAVASPRSPKMRHSRTQSHLSGMALQGGLPIPPVPPLPSDIAIKGAQVTDVFGSPARPVVQPSTPGAVDRTPSRAKRAFPTDLTRGIPPSASSPALSRMAGSSSAASSGPLLPSRRIPSGSVQPPEVTARSSATSNVKSVEEKKHMVSRPTFQPKLYR